VRCEGGFFYFFELGLAASGEDQGSAGNSTAPSGGEPAAGPSANRVVRSDLPLRPHLVTDSFFYFFELGLAASGEDQGSAGASKCDSL
jgi:hypothetical protein